MLGNYVKNGYVKSGYIKVYEISTKKEKLNFIVDTKETVLEDIERILPEKVGSDYKDNTTIIFGKDISVATKENDVFGIRKLSVGINDTQIENITKNVISSVINDEEFKRNIVNNTLLPVINNEQFIRDVAENVSCRINVTLKAPDDTILATPTCSIGDNNTFTFTVPEELSGAEYKVSFKVDYSSVELSYSGSGSGEA